MSEEEGWVPGSMPELLAAIDERTFNHVFAVGLSEIQELNTLSDSAAAQRLRRLIQQVAGFECKPGVRQIPWSTYANPCVNKFVGNNGGKTYRGVDEKTIKIGIRKFAVDAGDVTDQQAAAQGAATRAEGTALVKKYTGYFNKVFELYGRQVQFVDFNSRTSNGIEEVQSRGQEGACADATDLAETEKVFARLGIEDVETEDGTMPREVADWSPNPEQLYGQSELSDILGKTIQGLPAYKSARDIPEAPDCAILVVPAAATMQAESARGLLRDLYLRGNLPVFDGAGGPGSANGVFDGIDLDWEWPGSEGHEHNTVRPEDKENFTALVQEFRDQLDDLEADTGREFELTAFLPADPEKIELGFEMDRLMPNFDFVTIQGYDYHGAWEDTTNHQSNLLEHPDDPGPNVFSTETTVQAYLDRGVDPADMVLGLPFYSRGWTGVPPGPDGDGLFQDGTGPAPGSYEAGIEDWKVVKDLPGFDLYRDDDLGTAWLYDGTTFWTYDDETALAQKTDWAVDNGLGGVMIWSIDGDDANGSLMAAVDAALGG